MTAPMTPALARRWLKAVRETRQQYLDGVQGERGCPLCVSADKSAFLGCSSCLWNLFSKTHCADHMHEHTVRHQGQPGKIFFDPIWRRLSLARLSRWTKRLEAIIEEGGK